MIYLVERERFTMPKIDQPPDANRGYCGWGNVGNNWRSATVRRVRKHFCQTIDGKFILSDYVYEITINRLGLTYRNRSNKGDKKYYMTDREMVFYKLSGHFDKYDKVYWELHD
jgi:hypothetical protein